MNAELEATRARLSLVERELSQLGTRHDIAMSAFRFDEARDLQRRITVLEREHAGLMATLPPTKPRSPEAPIPIRVGKRAPGQRRRPSAR